MSSDTPTLHLPSGITLTPDQVDGFLWGGRESGLRWLQALPSLIESICQKHKITISSELPDMRMNLVLFGDSATHGPVVLKLSPYDEIATEFRMAHYVSGHGYPRVFGSDFDAGWLVMERVFPGTTLQNLSERNAIADSDATTIAANLLVETNLPVPPDAPFPDLLQWLKSLFDYQTIHGESGPLPIEQVNLALRHADWLLQLPDEPRLLHGDFHHGNIIQGKDGWMLIDPKGVIAPLVFEVGPWFYNPLDVDKRDDLPALFDARLNIFANALNTDRVTLWRAIFVACVLSDCWTVEDAHPEYCHHSSITKALLELPESSAER